MAAPLQHKVVFRDNFNGISRSLISKKQEKKLNDDAHDYPELHAIHKLLEKQITNSIKGILLEDINNNNSIKIDAYIRDNNINIDEKYKFRPAMFMLSEILQNDMVVQLTGRYKTVSEDLQKKFCPVLLYLIHKTLDEYKTRLNII